MKDTNEPRLDVSPDQTLNELSEMLKRIIEESGTSTTLKYEKASNLNNFKYPLLMFKRSSYLSVRADNALYGMHEKFTVTHIQETNDDVLNKLLLTLPMCSHDKAFYVDNLLHNVFTIYL